MSAKSIENPHDAVQLKKINDAWWFVSCEGEMFVSLGINHVEAPLMAGPHNRERTKGTYGSDFVNAEGLWNPEGDGVRRWTTRVRVDMRRWGFNTFGYHTMVPYQYLGSGLHYVRRAFTAAIEPYHRNMETPNIFSDTFADRTRRTLETVCADGCSDPYLLGYAFADCPPWRTDTAHAQLWLDSLAVERGGGTSVEQLAEQWYRLHHDLVREFDPCTPILGDKLLLGPDGVPDYLIPLLKEYTDLVYVQWQGHFADQMDVLRDLHAATGLPILLGNSSFSVHLPCHKPHSKGSPVASQMEVGQAYADYLRAALSEPYIVGWHYDGYVEGRPGVEPDYDPTLCRQCGLLDPDERVHEDAVTWIRSANAHAMLWHSRVSSSCSGERG
ncbi:MAG: hypothetical protein KAI66_01455 [Lentisphaeria bacterium]|nr:hypothetical protein [Lentisphaeria bacterium]